MIRSPSSQMVRMRSRAAVGVMRDVGHEAEEAAVREHRAHHVDVGQVRAAARVRIVGDEHVARRQRRDRIAREDLPHDAEQRAEMHGDVLGLGDHLAAGVEDGRRAVLALLDIGRVGGLDERGAHLLGDREEGRADHLERHAVHGVSPRSRTTRKPRSSTVASWAGRMSVVASNCSTTAGPAMRCPAREPAPGRRPGRRRSRRSSLDVDGAARRPRPRRGSVRRAAGGEPGRIEQPARDRAHVDDLHRLVRRGVAVDALVRLEEAPAERPRSRRRATSPRARARAARSSGPT